MSFQFFLIGMGRIGQVSFPMSPDLFDRIQFWGIRRKLFHQESGLFFQKLFNFLAFVDFSSIPQDQDLSRYVAQEIL